MLGDNIAVLDLGTNSFHILIAKIEEEGFEVLLKRKIFVKLAADGIDIISDEKKQLALDVLGEYKELMNEYNVSKFKAFGTAGLRTAKNASSLIDEALTKYNIPIEVINGDREAELIWKGVREAVDLNSQPRLIMDIGGGSTEFIIANYSEILWKKSYAIGANVLKNKFHKIEPIANEEYKTLVNYLETTLSELWEKIQELNPICLVGASGSFMSLVNMQRSFNMIYPILEGKSELVNLSGLKLVHLVMLKSDLSERMAIPDLETARAPMMTVATTLMSVVISHLKPERSIVISHYALKEGMLMEMKNNSLSVC